MAFHPVDKQPTNLAVDVQEAFRSVTQPMRVRENALMAATVNDIDFEETRSRVEAGSRTDIQDAKQRIANANREGEAKFLEQQFEKRAEPQDTASSLVNEQMKRDIWNKAGDNLFLEHAIALNDPTVDANLMRFMTNLQTGEEAMQEAVAQMSEDTGFFGYGWDFIDRYFLRAMVIGGFEDIFGRQTQGGRDHTVAAMTMDPDEYSRWIKTRVDQVKQEGFFTGDNFFAMSEEFNRFQNAGQDPLGGLWRAFGVVDVLPLAALVTKGVKSVSSVRRAKTIGGQEAADNTYETMLKAEGDAPSPRNINDGTPDVLTPTADDIGGAGLARTQRIKETNEVIREMDHLNEVGATGRGIDSDEVVRAAQANADALAKRTNNPIVNISRPVRRDATGNFIWSVKLGTVRHGKPYANVEVAERRIKSTGIREDFPTARAVPVDKDRPELGAHIEIDQRLDPNMFVDEVGWKGAMNEVGKMVARFAGSQAATENKTLSALANIAEGLVSSVQSGKAATKLKKKIRAVDSDSQSALSSIFNNLRDGKDAGLRNNYNTQEFDDLFRKYHPKGKAPTGADREAFDAILQLGDAAYMQRAHLRLQKYVAADYQAIVLADGTRVPGRRFNGNTTEHILDVRGNTPRYQSDLRRNTVIWELDREIGSGIRYVANPSDVRILDHSDVLGYNAGGRRINPTANYFIVVEGHTPRAFLTAVTAKQASKAVEQISTIQKASRNGTLTDEVIQVNNDWNTNIQSVDDLVAFSDEKGVNLLEVPVVSKNRDGELATGEVRDGFSQTWDDLVTFGMHRQDDVLTEYGGAEARQFDAVSAIFDDFGSITHQFAWNDYTQAALHSWLKSARRAGSGWDVGPEADPRRAFENAKFRETTNPNARELGIQHAIIRRRLGHKSEAFRAMESYGAAAQEFVFNTTKGRVELPRDPVAGAAQGLLTFGFVSAFGLMNFSQFFVQGYHALTIAAISPKAGFQAVTMYPALRMALMAPDTAMEKLAVKRLAKHRGMSTEAVEELLDYIRTSGRDIIDGSTMERGTGQAFGVAGWKGESYLPSTLRDVQRKIGTGWRGAMKAGLTPFREGERAARLTGITTAVMEYQTKFPGKAINTAHARRWITDREQALTFRMTNVNRAFMQEGFGKLPTQWFSYTLRSMENVIIGRDFTAGERARMALMLFPGFGLTGLGMASASDWLAEKVGAEPAGELNTFIKYGIWDTLLDMVGVEVAVAERLAPITLIQDVYSNIVGGEQSPLLAALGPSGDISGKVFDQVFRITTDIHNGTPVLLSESMIRFARQWTGVDNAAKAVGIWNTGLYRSRTGKQLPFELSGADAIAQLLGFSAREVNEYYQEKGWQYNENLNVRNFTNEIRNDYTLAMEYINGDNPERGMQMLQEIQWKIALSGLSPIDQATVRNGLRVTTSEELYRMQIERMKRGEFFAGERIEETFDFIGTNQ